MQNLSFTTLSTSVAEANLQAAGRVIAVNFNDSRSGYVAVTVDSFTPAEPATREQPATDYCVEFTIVAVAIFSDATLNTMLYSKVDNHDEVAKQIKPDDLFDIEVTLYEDIRKQSM